MQSRFLIYWCFFFLNDVIFFFAFYFIFLILIFLEHMDVVFELMEKCIKLMVSREQLLCDYLEVYET